MSEGERWHQSRPPKNPPRCHCSMCVYSDSESDAEGSTFEDEDVRTSQGHPHRRQSYHHCQNCLRPSNASSDDKSALEPRNHAPDVTFLPSRSTHGGNEITVAGGTNSAVDGWGRSDDYQQHHFSHPFQCPNLGPIFHQILTPWGRQYRAFTDLGITRLVVPRSGSTKVGNTRAQVPGVLVWYYRIEFFKSLFWSPEPSPSTPTSHPLH
ncbi:hypothetical protein BDP27DRAFT_1428693 [Rhodocollybia butyracea]|uniref:Uncharacterized protein n=1 Tax=Rhodocollybia butyracea TaxID=206335 RepID=A0A9P5PGM1_9AGAR|nr:hypothetical protein BDP27DRAFT_1428693 [Rhodocollybia butyracea]